MSLGDTRQCLPIFFGKLIGQHDLHLGKQIARLAGGRSYAMTLDALGRILVAGVSGGTFEDMVIWRYNPDGTLDSSFDNPTPMLRSGRAVSELGEFD